MHIRNRIIALRDVRPDEVAPNPRNWRTHPQAQRDALRGVLADVGIAAPVIAYHSEAYGGLMLIDGHERMTVGVPFPAVILDVTDAEAATLLATFDPLGAMAETDAAALDALLRDVTTDSPAVAAMLDELAQQAGIVPAAIEPGQGGDEFDTTPDETSPTRCQIGDLWLIGGVHRLAIGDSTDPATVARLMGGERAASLVSDPPYSSGGFTRGDRTLSVAKKYVQSGTLMQRPDFAGDNRDQRAWIGWMERWLALYMHYVQAGSVIAIWTDWRQIPATTDAIQGAGWVWRGIAVWNKTESARPLYGRFRPQAEYLVWGSAGDLPLNDGRPSYPGVFTKAVDSNKEHIAQKPIEAAEWSLSMVAADGLNLDPFLGSGTTLIAAHRTGRRCYGVEIEPRYGDVILRRAEAEGLTVERAE